MSGYMDDEDEMTFLEKSKLIYNDNSHDSVTAAIGVSVRRMIYHQCHLMFGLWTQDVVMIW